MNGNDEMIDDNSYKDNGNYTERNFVKHVSGKANDNELEPVTEKKFSNAGVNSGYIKPPILQSTKKVASTFRNGLSETTK